MTPVYIAGCFAMLHPASGQRGVLICGSLGDEALNVYRPLAVLAEQFALAGSPALRLEYYGTGDSGGEDDEPDRFQAWLDSIVAGVRHLRQACGVTSVTLVGVRVGAALAARAACDIGGVGALILLSPLPTGRRFLRELVLRAHATAEIWQTDSRIEQGNWFEAHGVRMDRATRDKLDRLDVAKLPCCPAPLALVLDDEESPARGVMADRLRRLGVEATSETRAGLDLMLRDPYENTVPHEAFARVVGWHAAIAGRPAAAREPDPVETTNSLRFRFGEETPVRFGPDDALFGILTLPAHPRSEAPPVLIANTGANPRSGNSRVAVGFARWLAENGIASLRMDGAGIGDSAIETGERGQPYSSQSDADLTTGVDELSRRFGKPVMVLGMCSGAYHALRGAYDDQRVGGLVLVNLQKFHWEGNESLSVVQRRTFRTTRFYLRNVFSPQVWQRLMHGDINITGITRALAGRAVRRVVAASDPAMRLWQGEPTPVSRVRQQVRDLQRRSVPILFVLSGNDPGLDEIAAYFGTQGRQFRRLSNVTFHILDGADHTFSTHWAREELRGLIAGFLRQRFAVTIDAAEPAAPAPHWTPASVLHVAITAPLAIDTTGSPA